MRPKSWQVAALCTGAVFAWQWMVATGYFHGNWNGFFFAGDGFTQSPEVKAEGSYVLTHSFGYDAQFYHAIAHDPLDLHGTDRYIDAPGLRYTRVLIPAVSYVLGAGRLFWIDRIYRALELAAFFLGVACMSAYFARRGKSTWWGATFLLVTGVHMSLERQLPDLPLCALIVAAVLALETGHRKLTWLALALACLDRDTGIVALAAFAGMSLWERRPREVLMWGSAFLPELGWLGYVRTSAAAKFDVPSWHLPFHSIFFALQNLHGYPTGSGLVTAIHVMEVVAILAAVLASALGVWIWIREKNTITWLAVSYAVFGIVISGSDGMEYRDVYGFARVLSPLLLALMIEAIRRKEATPAAPLALILPRAVLPVGLMTFTALRNLL